METSTVPRLGLAALVALAGLSWGRAACGLGTLDSQRTEISGLRPGAPGTNPYAQGLSIILQRLGHADADYTRVMGLSGMAFAIQVDLAGPKLDGRYDVAWWPNDCWAFDARMPFVARAFGRALTKVAGDPVAFRRDPEAHYRSKFAGAVSAAIGRGAPVLAQRDAAWVINAVEPGTGRPVGFWPSPDQPFGANGYGYPWGLLVPGAKTKPLSRFDAETESLRWAVALGEGSAIELADAASLGRPDIEGDPREVLLTGRRAYARWLDLLHDEQGLGGLAWDVNIIIHLVISRRAAVGYLSDVAARKPGAAAGHLRAAADLYKQVLDEAERAPYWHQYKDRPGEIAGGRRAYIEMVRRIASLEARATEQISRAVGPTRSLAGVKIPGDWMAQDSVALALQAAGRCVGVALDYDRCGAALGNVFAPAVDTGESCASWWHCQGRLGTRNLEPCARLLGLTVARSRASGQNGDARATVVRAALDRGAVLVADGGWDAPGYWNMAGQITGVRPDGGVVGTPAFGDPNTLLRQRASIWEIGRASGNAARRGAFGDVLRNARDRIRGQGVYLPSDRLVWGVAAVERMARLLRETPGYCAPCVSRGAKGWSDLADNARTILGSARSAASVLEAQAAKCKPEAKAPLERAASAYRSIARHIAPFANAEAMSAKPQRLEEQRRAADEVFAPILREFEAVAAALDEALQKL